MRGLIVHDGPTTSDWGPAAAAIGDLEVVTPAQVEAAIAKGGRA